MKRIISLLICFVMITALVSCTGAGNTDAGKKSIVCTTFPQYDWTVNILGDKADEWEVSILLDSGTDLHNFQPSAEDIITINSCDLFIYVGGDSDGWVEDVFKTNTSDAELIDLMHILDDRLLEAGHSHGPEDEHDENFEHNEFCDHEHDEHIWLSLENAEELCEAIADRLGVIDPDNAQVYESNCGAYTEKLEALEEKYQNTVDTAKHRTLVFADRYPFAYLCEDLGLTAHAAFSGCSAETEASFEKIVELAGEVDNEGLSAVAVIDSSDRKLADTVISNTNTKDQTIVELDSMQSVTREDIEAGESYLAIMEKNLEALETALN